MAFFTPFFCQKKLLPIFTHAIQSAKSLVNFYKFVEICENFIHLKKIKLVPYIHFLHENGKTKKFKKKLAGENEIFNTRILVLKSPKIQADLKNF